MWRVWLVGTVLTLLYLVMVVCGIGGACAAEPPRAALPYRADLTRSARFVWGMEAPIATMAAQIHQESGWRPDVCSAFACGLTQFTDPTADWIGEIYASELGPVDVFNPGWALRALARYDRHLYSAIAGAATECDRWAMTLSAYNGGLGWVNRDRRLTTARGGDASRWWGSVELHSQRAAWAIRENRGYPRNILKRWQPIYDGWGPAVVCAP